MKYTNKTWNHFVGSKQYRDNWDKIDWKPNIGSTLDSLLEETSELEEVNKKVMKRIKNDKRKSRSKV